MPTPNETLSKIKARAWQAIAQSEIDVSQIPKGDLDQLVSLITDAAVLEIDQEMGQDLAMEMGQKSDEIMLSAKEVDAALDGDEEIVLWEGRPFLSIKTRYTVTTQRVRIFTGLIGKEREDIELVRIQDMDQKQTLRERIFNLGDISLRSHDPSHPRVVLNNIREPEAVHEIIRKAVMKAREKYRLSYREEM